MSIHRRINGEAVFTPSEVALLVRAFESEKIDGESDSQRDARASRIIANYMAGITSEEELVSLSRQPFGR